MHLRTFDKARCTLIDGRLELLRGSSGCSVILNVSLASTSARSVASGLDDIGHPWCNFGEVSEGCRNGSAVRGGFGKSEDPCCLRASW